jgi:tetratricopeptide (TPR) repeat protein
MIAHKQKRTKVFISYSSKDANWLERLRTHLQPLERDHKIEIWDDTKILPGSNWRAEIEKSLQSAKVAVLLISADFINSDFITKNELPPLLEAAEREDAVILPIIVSPIRKTAAILQYQTVNDPSRPLISLRRQQQEEVFVEVADRIVTLLAALPKPDRQGAITTRATYRDFDLRLYRKDGGCFVELTASPSESTSGPEPFELPEQKVADWSDSIRMGPAARRACRYFGMKLFDALFPQPIRAIWEKCDGFYPSLRLRLDIRDPELESIPWEMAYNGHYHLAMAPQRPIVRYLYNNHPNQQPENIEALNILMVILSPPDQSLPLRMAKEVEYALHSLRDRGIIGRLEIRRSATLKELRQELENEYHVLHYTGPLDTEENLLPMTTGSKLGPLHRIDIETLSYLVQDTSIRLLTLQHCEASHSQSLNPLPGIGQTAFKLSIPAIVAMQNAISGEIAAEFFNEFYKALARGNALEHCMFKGRMAVMAHASLDQPDWASPVLYSSAPEGLLWQFSYGSQPHRWPQISPGAAPDSEMNRYHARDSLTMPSVKTQAVLHNLTNPDYVCFVNRETEIQRIIEAIDPQSRISAITITGIGGVGRSALAHEIARRCLDFSEQNVGDPRRFHGIVWASAQRVSLSSGEAIRPKKLIKWSLDDLYATIASVLKKQPLLQASPYERNAVMEDFLREGRYLLILDDADDIEEDQQLLEFLKNLPLPTKAILTSNCRLEIGGVEVPLFSLNEQESLQLLRSDARAARVDAVEQASTLELQNLIIESDGLPIALRWAVSQLRDSGQQVSWVVNQLAKAHRSQLVEYCLDRSIKKLTADEFSLLLAFALFPRPTQLEEAGKAAGISPENFNQSLNRLIQLRLLQHDHGSERYLMMLMTRYYALRQMDNTYKFKQEATRRAVGAMRAAALSNGGVSNWEGYERLESELENFMWAAQQAYDSQEWQTVIDFRKAMCDLVNIRGYWNEALKLGELAFDAAARISDYSDQAWCTIYPFGQTHFHRGKYDEAQRWCEKGLAMFQQQCDTYGIIAAERYLGRVMQAKGELDRAEILFSSGLEKALSLNPCNRAYNQEANLRASLADLAESQGRYDQSRRGYEQALALFRRTRSQTGVATMLQNLGDIARITGNYDQAERLLRESLQTLQGTGWISRKARVIYSLALLAEETFNLTEATELLLQAKAEFQTLSAVADQARTDAALTRVSTALAYQRIQKGKA